MFKHLLILNFRNLLNNKFFTLSTIAGMSITLACSIYLLVFLQTELSIDAHIRNEGSVVRILMKSPVFDEVGITTFDDLAEKLTSQFPEVENASFISSPGMMKITIGDNIFLEKAVLIPDSNFFNVFKYKLKEGDVSSCLTKPLGAVITEKLASKYFGNSSSYVGREFKANDEIFTVTGIISEFHELSHLKIGILLSRQSFNRSKSPAIKMGFTYLKLRHGVNKVQLQAKLNHFSKKLLPFEMDKEISFEIEEAENFYFHKDDQAYSYINNVFSYQDKDILLLSGVIGLAIIILSLINYVVFAQTRLLFKAKQVVLYRIFGQNPFAIFISFSIDALLVLLISLFFAFFLISLIGPKIIGLSTINLNVYDFITIKSIISSALFVFVLALLLSIINSIVLPKINISDNLSGNYGTSLRAKKRISWIIGIQITITFILLITVIGTLAQIRFIKSYDLGYDADNIIDISLGELPVDMDLKTMQMEFANIAGVVGVSLCTGTPISGRWFYNEQVNEVSVTMNQIYADEHYLSTVGLRIIDGRDFIPIKLSDTLSVIVNETAARLFDLKVDSFFNYFQVVGIVKDFNYSSFKESIGPVIITYSTFNNRRESQEFRLLVRISDSTVIETIKSKWSQLFPNFYFNVNSLNAEVSNLHRKEFERITIVVIMGCVSIGITIFGLMGFSYFLVRSKLKEIAIRKVFGANTNDIRLNLLMSILKIYTISSIISVVASWYILKNWLSNYNQRIDLTVGLFLLPVLIMLITIALSVSFQIFTYTRLNPSKIMRYE